MPNTMLKILIFIWTFVGLGLAFYLVCFPIFMKKKIAQIVNILETIANSLKKKED